MFFGWIMSCMENSLFWYLPFQSDWQSMYQVKILSPWTNADLHSALHLSILLGYFDSFISTCVNFLKKRFIHWIETYIWLSQSALSNLWEDVLFLVNFSLKFCNNYFWHFGWLKPPTLQLIVWNPFLSPKAIWHIIILSI